jgi:hypothetical protein
MKGKIREAEGFHNFGVNISAPGGSRSRDYYPEFGPP